MKWFLKLIFIWVTSLILLAMLAGGFVLLIFSLLRWLLTGQKPQIFSFMSAVNQWKKGNLWPSNKNETENIVDVEVKDVTGTEHRQRILEK